MELASNIVAEFPKSESEVNNQPSTQCATKKVAVICAEARMSGNRDISCTKGDAVPVHPINTSDIGENKILRKPIRNILNLDYRGHPERDQHKACCEIYEGKTTQGAMQMAPSIKKLSDKSEFAGSDVSSQQTTVEDFFEKTLVIKLKELLFKVKDPEIQGIWDVYIVVLTMWISVVIPYMVGFTIPVSLYVIRSVQWLVKEHQNILLDIIVKTARQ